MKKGLFITFEGVDGCGKSTQMRLFAEKLTQLGVNVTTTREPGGCMISEKIREIILDPQNTTMSEYTEALLYAASRAQHIDEVILPNVNAGKIVLCDRYIDSSVAYQGEGRGMGVERVLDINKYAVENCMPDITIFMDYSPDLAFKRMNPSKQHDRLELSGEDFFKRVYTGYKKLETMYPDRFVSVKPLGTKTETAQVIFDLMLPHLKQRGIL